MSVDFRLFYATARQPAEWWEKHVVTYNGKAVARIYGKDITCIRYDDGTIHKLTRNPIHDMQISRIPPADETEWEHYRALASELYPGSQVVVTSNYENDARYTRFIQRDGTWARQMPTMIDLLHTFYRTLDELDNLKGL